jgi:4-amino-4-deoxy-L-arabinose transferase-like glycosyltransferase
LASWVLFPLLFFSFSQSKLPGYILPCVPALVALIAAEINRLGDASPAARVGVISAGIALAGLVLATPRELSRLNLRVEQMDLIVAGLGLVAATSAVAIFLFWRRRRAEARTPSSPAIGGPGHGPQRLTRALVVLVLLIGGMVLYLNRRILPALDGSLSARQLARSLQPHLPEVPLYVSAGLPRAWQYGLEYYLDRPLPRSLPGSPHEGMRIRMLVSRRELPLLPAGWEIVQVSEVVPAQEIVLLEAEAIGPAPQSEAPEGRKP